MPQQVRLFYNKTSFRGYGLFSAELTHKAAASRGKEKSNRTFCLYVLKGHDFLLLYSRTEQLLIWAEMKGIMAVSYLFALAQTYLCSIRALYIKTETQSQAVEEISERRNNLIRPSAFVGRKEGCLQFSVFEVKFLCGKKPHDWEIIISQYIFGGIFMFISRKCENDASAVMFSYWEARPWVNAAGFTYFILTCWFIRVTSSTQRLTGSGRGLA